jgi:hypothetical protein
MRGVLAILIVLVHLSSSRGYSISLYGKETQCFSVYAVKGATCTGKYEVMSEESAMSVEVLGPKGKLVYEKEYDGSDESKSEAPGEAFQFDAEDQGEFKMCFRNGKKDDSENSAMPSTVGFSFHVGLAKEEVDAGGGSYNSLLVELDTLQQGLDFIKDHESFMNQREDLHKDSLDAINSSVLTWTILESVILVCLSIWQIAYINKIFETRRSL